MGLASPVVEGPSGAGGWHPDPTGRFELRWHNGSAWTGDVATHGQRFLDPLDRLPAAGGDRNGTAIASFVIGLVCISLAWVPFVFTVAAIASVVGVVLAAIALRHPARAGRALAAWGLVLSSTSMAALPVGWMLSARVIDRLERGATPGPYEISVDSCESGRFSITLHGSVTNRDDRPHAYAIRVHYLVDGAHVASDRATIDTVQPGSSADFVTIADYDVADGRIAECTIAEVSTNAFEPW